jgi:hypothetical protein
MNAKNWIYRLPENGYKKVSAPKAGGKYVGVATKGVYGHALWFEGVNKNGTISISEYNYNYLGGYGTRNIAARDYIWYEIKAPAAPKPKPSTGGSIKVGSKVRPKTNVSYNGTRLASFVTRNTYTVIEVKGDRAVLGNGLNTAFKTNNLTLVGNPSSGGGALKVGDNVTVVKPVDEKGRKLKVSGKYRVMEINGNRVVIGKNGVVTAAMNKSNLKKA